MIDKTFVDAITELKGARVLTVGDKHYFTEEVFNAPLPDEPLPDAFHVRSLTSLVDYLESGRSPEATGSLIHVYSPVAVRIIGAIEGLKKRRATFLVAEHKGPVFEFGTFMSHSKFMLQLQSQFIDYGHRAEILRILGTVKDEAARTSLDNGVTQTVTASSGITLQAEVAVPNPVVLQPFRTFPEIEQVPSNFVLRLQSKKDALPEVGLFESDGGAWAHETVRRIKDYLVEKLPQAVVLA